MSLSKTFEKVILGHCHPASEGSNYQLGFVDHETQERVFSYGAIVRLAEALEEVVNGENSRDTNESQGPKV